jgi:hypothetical protein
MLLVVPSPAMGATVKSTTQGCPAFDATTHSTIEGHNWTFSDQIYAIAARGVGCKEAHRQILRADRALNTRSAGLGKFIRVAGWKCTSFRPFTGESGPLHWDSVCQLSGSYRVNWSERTLSSQHSS